MDTSMGNNFAREIVDDLSVQRMQENVGREFDKQSNSGISSGCLSSGTTLISNGIYKVDHQLGREPIGFFLMSQVNASSLYCEIVENPDSNSPAEKTKTIFLKFSDKAQASSGVSPSADPGVFRVFVY